MNKNMILLIMQKETEAIKILIHEALKNYDVKIIEAKNPVDGLIAYNQYEPSLIIIEAEMQFLNGFSLSAIIKGTVVGRECSIYLIVEKISLMNAQVDHYIELPIRKDLFISQIKQFFEKQYMNDYFSEAIRRAKINQNKLLPQKIQAENYRVSYLYSPFSDLSGDFLDYWVGKNNNGLYGFLFDCTGHDIGSSQQVYEIRSVLRTGFRIFQNKGNDNLGNILKRLNDEMFELHGDDQECVAALAFYLDFENKVLRYCTAGIPSFYIKYVNSDDFKEIEMENYLIGYEEDVNFDEGSMPLDDIDHIVFSSDGFSDLTFKQASTLKCSKADDVSAVFISLSKQRKDEF